MFSSSSMYLSVASEISKNVPTISIADTVMLLKKKIILLMQS